MRTQLIAVGTSIALLGVASPAHADLRYASMSSSGGSDISDMVEIRMGGYRPSIDTEFGGDATPWADLFGQRRRLMYELEYDRQLYRGFGSFGVGMHLGWYRIEASALDEAGNRSPDRTQFSAVPTRVSAVYRFDVLQERFGIPFSFAAKAGLDYYFWWVNAQGETAVFRNEAGDERTASGGTGGYHFSLGAYLLLDFFAQDMAQSFDSNVGVNNSYFFVEYLGTRINNFGSGSSWDLSDDQLLFGLAFEF
jgi:hypothetical protein